MGQCNFSDEESNFFGELFNSHVNEQGSLIHKSLLSERDLALWEY
jgi:hypothetical protein